MPQPTPIKTETADKIRALFQADEAQATALLVQWRKSGAFDPDHGEQTESLFFKQLLERAPMRAPLVRAIQAADLFPKGDDLKRMVDGQTLAMARARLGALGLVAPNPETGAALAMLIDHVDPSWWLQQDMPGDDEGAQALHTLARAAMGTEPMAALIKRGVDPLARFAGPGRPLAVMSITSDKLMGFHQAGGDLEAPLWESHPAGIELFVASPLWRHVCWGEERTYPHMDALAQMGAISRREASLVRHFDNMRKGAGSGKGAGDGLRAMVSWPTIATQEGDPMWMHALAIDPGIVGMLPTAKPALCARDSQGRSAWFWLICKADNAQKFAPALDKIFPHQAFACDTQGRGIMTQAIAHYMTQHYTGPSEWKTDNLRMATQQWDEGLVFGGLTDLDFSRLSQQALAPNGMLYRDCPHFMSIEGLWLRLAPEQRGHLMVGALAVVAREPRPSNPGLGRRDPVAGLERMIVELGMDKAEICWPEIDPAFLLAVNEQRQSLAGKRPKILALLEHVEVHAQAQAMAKHLPMAVGRRSSVRL